MKIAVSGCLLGEKIRFDAGHKRDHFITDELSTFAEFIPFCPEHLAFGTPRPSIRLIQDKGVFVQSNKTGEDLTERLQTTSTQELHKIQAEPIRAIIFKSKSPSCGLGSAKAYFPNGFSKSKEDGIFAHLCREAFPLLPMEEEGRLQDMWLRENFVMQLFAYDAVENLRDANPSMNDLVKFHTKNKFLLQAKSEPLYRQLGHIVANHENLPIAQSVAAYMQGFKEAIAKKSSIKRNRNVLEHLAGFFKKELDTNEKALLHEQINDYAAKIIPLITPVSTIYLYAKKYEMTYLLEQTFLNPYPKHLALRSHLSSGK
jgi:uncharacterized protein YbgA (DUF1722 family)/uncharacterized protein YbbK (DUF523 family)